MNTGINMHRRNSFYIVLSLLLVTINCSNGQNDSIDFGVTSKVDSDSTKIQLTFNFTSSKDQEILLNWDALSVYDPSFEEEGILNNDAKLEDALSKIQYTQFVIENQDNDKRFFSDIQLFEGETMEMKNVFSLEQHIDTIRLSSNKTVSRISKPILVNRLKIQPTDHKIRLHYLFKPTIDQEKAGYRSKILTSNWFILTNN